jgi:acyl-coenzyme A synthetase/AMP-(fatty) acid ligase
MGVMLATACLGARLAEQSITSKFPLDQPITHTIVSALQAGGENRIVVDQSFSPANFTTAEKAAIWQEGVAEAEVPWIIVTTSGTTGLPKAVGLSQRLVCKRSFAVKRDFGPENTRFASLFPYPSRPFMARGMAAVLNGAAIVDRGPWGFWQEAGVTMVSGSLAQVQTALKVPEGAVRLPKLEVIGAKLPKEDAARLLQGFALIDDTYGATETSKTWSNQYSLAPEGTLARCGEPVSSIIEIVDSQGAPVSEGGTGTVRVKSDCSASFYLFSETGASEILQDGWFYPGDTARFGVNGFLDIIGRTSGDVISINSSKISGKLIDLVLETIEGITAAAAFRSPKAGTQEILAFVEFEDGVNMAQTIELARHTCRERLGAEFVPAKLWPINLVPRFENGTIDRDKCASLILSAIKDL